MRPPLDIKELEERIHAGSKSIDDHFNLAYLYLDTGNYERALEVYEALKQLPLTNPDMARVLYETGEALRESNRTDEAVEAYQRALTVLASEEESGETLLLNGLSHHNLSLFGADEQGRQWHAHRALESFQSIVSGNLSLPDTYVTESGTYLEYTAYSHIGNTYRRLGDYDEALRSYQRALDASSCPSERVGALIGIASTYSAKKNYAIAAKYHREALRKAGKEVPTAKICFEMAKMYYEAGRLSESEKAFINAIKKRLSDPCLKDNREFEVDILYYLGSIAYTKAEHRKALDHFRRILELVADDHPCYSLTRLHMGHIHFKDKEYRKAMEEYKLVISAPKSSQTVVEEAKEYLAHASNALVPPSSPAVFH